MHKKVHTHCEQGPRVQTQFGDTSATKTTQQQHASSAPSCQCTHTCVLGLGCDVVIVHAVSNRGGVAGSGREVRVSDGGSHQAVSGSGPCKIAQVASNSNQVRLCQACAKTARVPAANRGLVINKQAKPGLCN